MVDSSLSILGCPCLPESEGLIDVSIGRLIEQGQGYSVAINAEKILKYSRDSQVRDIIDQSFFPYPDGAGAVLGLKWLHGVGSEKINFPIRVLEYCNENKVSVFIAGADEDTHRQAIEIIREKYCRIVLLDSTNGYVGEDEIVSRIKKCEPQVVLLAMGSPRQELLANKIIFQHCVNTFVVGCGGALDIIAGKLKRAPAFLVNNNLEWMYRLVQEPWRVRRQKFLPIFFAVLIAEVFKLRVLKKVN